MRLMDYLDCWKEVEGKRVHDPFLLTKMSSNNYCSAAKQVCVLGPIIIGSGPSGLAAAACLKEKGVPSLILERENCIASLWQLKTYDRLRLHLPKQFCQLPLLPFPSDFPNYPTKQQFISYMEGYARHFKLDPVFGRTVVSAEYDNGYGFWRVRTVGGEPEGVVEYVSRWVIVATGENAEEVVPKIEGMSEFVGQIVHTSGYKTGECFYGKRVLVVGCGNSGMEVCLDLCNYDAQPSLVVRDSVHVLPQEMLGTSTFGLSMWLLKWLPVRMVDRFLLLMSRLMIGDTAKFGLNRPDLGPLELKKVSGKTPVLDIGTLELIKSGKIKENSTDSPMSGHPCTTGVVYHPGRPLLRWKAQISSYTHDNEQFGCKGAEVKFEPSIRTTDDSDGAQLKTPTVHGLHTSNSMSVVWPGIKRLTRHSVEFVDGRVENFDAIIFATGYKSNVPTWLKDTNFFSEKDGFPRKPFPHGWKGENGLFAVGFTKRGLLGTSMDATRIAEDIEQQWKLSSRNRRPSVLMHHCQSHEFRKETQN